VFLCVARARLRGEMKNDNLNFGSPIIRRFGIGVCALLGEWCDCIRLEWKVDARRGQSVWRMDPVGSGDPGHCGVRFGAEAISNNIVATLGIITCKTSLKDTTSKK
jgi:hypothetical protein